MWDGESTSGSAWAGVRVASGDESGISDAGRRHVGSPNNSASSGISSVCALWLLLAGLDFSFTMGLQGGSSPVVTAAAWAYLPLALSAWHASPGLPSRRERERRRWLWPAVFVLVSASASVVAFWGAFEGPGVGTVAARGALCGLGFLVSAALSSSFVVHAAFRARYPAYPGLACPVFAAFWTALWMLSGFSPLGAFAHPASTQAAWPAAAQMASVFGADGIAFLMAWSGALLAAGAARRAAPPALRFQGAVAALLLLSILAGGSARAGAARRRYAAAPPEGDSGSISASCVVRVTDPGSPTWPEAALWAATEAAIAQGDDLVLWSELGVATQDEASLLKRAAAAAAEGTAFLGITYSTPGCNAGGLGGGLGGGRGGVLGGGASGGAARELAELGAAAKRPLRAVENLLTSGKHHLMGRKPEHVLKAPGSDRACQNVFALLRPGLGPVNASAYGSVAFRFVKAHPVPIVEPSVARGPPVLQFEDTPFGRVTAAICFDWDFAGLLRQAGRARAALALQPGETWGPPSFAARHFAGNSLRAIENGLTMLRCSSNFDVDNALSGAISPWGERLALRRTGAQGAFRMSVRISRTDTIYSVYGGWAFGWLCLAGALSATYGAMAPVAWLPSAVAAAAADGGSGRRGRAAGVLVSGGGAEGEDTVTPLLNSSQASCEA